MAGLGYKDFTAGAVLTAAQVDGYLMEQAVMNFAGTAARGSALSSVQAAGMVAHVGGGTLTVYNGSSWAEFYPGTGSPGLAFVAGTAVANVTSFSVNNCFTSSYDFYRILIRTQPTSSNALLLRFRASGSDASGSDYNQQYLQAINTGVSSGRNLTNTSAQVMAQNTGHNAAMIDVFSPAIATPTIYQSLSARNANTSTPDQFLYAGGHDVSTAYDGFTVFMSAGTVTSATVRIYGYRNA